MHAALFDLDGVLVDTETLYTRIWDDIVRIYPTGIDNFAYKIKGNTLEKILSTYFPDPDTSRDIVRILREREDAMEYELFDGVAEFLAELNECGIPAAIVTSSGDAKMQRLFASLTGFRECFAAVITDSDVTHSKPHPEGYLLAATRLGADPHDCIVFEDSYAGIEAGKAAGAKVVGLATTNPRETLIDKADHVIDSFAGVSAKSLFEDLFNPFIKP